MATKPISSSQPRENPCTALVEKTSWLKPESSTDYLIGGLGLFCGIAAGPLIGGAAAIAYCGNRWIDSQGGSKKKVEVLPPPSDDQSTAAKAKNASNSVLKGSEDDGLDWKGDDYKRELPIVRRLPLPLYKTHENIPLPPPYFRKGAVVECSVQPADILSSDAAPLRNTGNTCFAASLAQVWLFDKEADIAAKVHRLWQRRDHLSAEEQRDFRDAKELLEFIRANRAYLADPEHTQPPSIDALIRILRSIVPQYDADYRQYLRDSTTQFLQSIRGDKGYIAWYENKMKEEQDQVNALQAVVDEQPEIAKDIEKLSRRIEKIQTILAFLNDVSQRKQVRAGELRQEMGKLKIDSLLAAPPQQDAHEMLQRLHDFIYEGVPRLQVTTHVTCWPGQNVQNPTSATMDPYSGITFLEPPSRMEEITHFDPVIDPKTGKQALDPETNAPLVKERIERRCVVDNASFPLMVRKAFLESDVKVRRTVVVDEFPVQADVHADRQDQLERAPNQLVLGIKRFAFDAATPFAIRGSIEGIEEVLEMSGDYFSDGQGARYRLDGVIIQEGGNRPSSGHYTAMVRKFDPETGESRFVHCNDSVIAQAEDNPDNFLRWASHGYILVFNRIN